MVDTACDVDFSIDEIDDEAVDSVGQLEDNTLKIKDIDDAIDDLDSESSTESTLLSLGSDWSDEPRDDIGTRIHQIYYVMMEQARIQEKKYQAKVKRRKEKYSSTKSTAIENSNSNSNSNSKQVTKSQNSYSILPFSLFEKFTHSEPSKSNDSAKTDKLSKLDILSLRQKTSKHFLETYHMQSDLSMRDPQDYAQKTLKFMTDNQKLDKSDSKHKKLPSKLEIARSMLLYQTTPIFTSFTTSKYPNVDFTLQESAPAMFHNIQAWMDGKTQSKQMDSIADMLTWIQKCSPLYFESKNGDSDGIVSADVEELCKRYANELFLQLTKQISGNPYRESIRKGLRLLYLLVLYSNPSKDIFLSAKYRTASMVTKYNKDMKPSKLQNTKLYSFATVGDAASVVWDAMMFVEHYGRLPTVPTFDDIYLIRTKDDINRSEEFSDLINNGDTRFLLSDLSIVRLPKEFDNSSVILSMLSKKTKKSKNDEVSEYSNAIANMSPSYAFSTKSIFNSIIDFSPKYSGSDKKAEMLSKAAVKMFSLINKIINVTKMSSKVSKTFNAIDETIKLLILCQQEKLLRDEYFAQLIKQTTLNVNVDHIFMFLDHIICIIVLYFMYYNKYNDT